MQHQQQQQQQPPQMFGNMPSQPQHPPTTLVTTEQIQKCLDENKNLIMAIMDSQNLGKLAECAQYQAQLQKNLMYLAAIADAQPPPSSGQPQPTQGPPQTQPQPQPQMVMQSPVPQGPSMQPPQPGMPQQQGVPYGARMPFQGQPFDPQSHHIQHQQTMAGMMGMRMGGNIGMHPGMQTGQGAPPPHFMDSHNRQEGSEGGSGDGKGK